MKKQESKFPKHPRLNSPERRETQRQVITFIGWLIRLIVEAIRKRKKNQ